MPNTSKGMGWRYDPTTNRLQAVFNGTEVFDFDANDIVFTAAATLSGAQVFADDTAVGLGTGSPADILWETADANANELLIQLPAGTATDVPVVVIGDTIENDDLGLFDAIVSTTVAVMGSTATATGPALRFLKSRGTNSAPTVVTSADDMGSIDFYGAVATGEFVRGARILAEMTGTIATTRGPGVLTFQTATDAAPSVLTTAMTITAAQIVTVPTVTDTTSGATGAINTLGGVGVTKKISTGAAGGTTGAVLFQGTTSGTVTLSVSDAAGTWTMILPAAVGMAGQQLTDAGANGITSWAAASFGAWKHDLGILDPEEALARVVKSPTHHFTYNKDVMPAGQAHYDGTEFAGIFAEEARWAMHGLDDGTSGAFSPVNAVGYLRAAIEALNAKVQRLEGAIA